VEQRAENEKNQARAGHERQVEIFLNLSLNLSLLFISGGQEVSSKRGSKQAAFFV
jgi:hypothetical protein